MRGQIIRVISGFYDIESDNQIYRVRGSGKMRNLNTSPVVGDFVKFESDELLTHIEPRRNELIRPKVANIDVAVIVASVTEPEISSFLIDKYLAIIEASNIEPIIIFTKVDKSKNPHKEMYDAMNYKSFNLNNNDFSRNEELDLLLKDKLCVFMGQSGVGKSSTIGNLSDQELEVQEISKALGRGKHTTRVVEIIKWKLGRLIDTPGFSSFELGMTKQILSQSYAIFNKYIDNCKFIKNCLHDYEKICGIKQAISDGHIPEERYNNYIRLLRGEDDNEKK